MDSKLKGALSSLKHEVKSSPSTRSKIRNDPNIYPDGTNSHNPTSQAMESSAQNNNSEDDPSVLNQDSGMQIGMETRLILHPGWLFLKYFHCIYSTSPKNENDTPFQ